MRRELATTALLAAISAALLTHYGGRVCPLMESLTYSGLGVRLFAAFAFCVVIRFPLGPAMPREAAPGVHFLADLFLWMGAGAIVTIWNAIGNAFPVESGLKLLVGCGALGFFSASWIAIDAEGLAIKRAMATGRIREFTGRTVSVANRFTALVTIAFVDTAIITSLILAKAWLMVDWERGVYRLGNMAGQASSPSAMFVSVAKEIAYVLGVMLLANVAVVMRYGANMRLLFRLEQEALDRASRGDYSARVPVATRDEFGRIAAGTNEMVAGLADRERIRAAFGKYVAEPVAKRILAGADGGRLEGEAREVAILFTDLRDYTTLSESLDPRQVVSVLNEYFGEVVAAVSRNGGMVDKFIGDAALAVFGVDGAAGAAESAVAAALELRGRMAGLNERLAARGLPAVRNGIGIHFGPVIAGSIGADERLEFTVIGDTVNAASRLESLTKTLGTTVAVTEDVFGRLSPAARDAFAFLGEHEVKGKAQKLRVYGVAEQSKTAAARP